MDYPTLRQIYRRALLEDVLPFWAKHSPDETNGGYFTCLDRSGAVYDRDKFVWLQARQVWTHSMLYLRLERRESWRQMAELGVRFLQQHGRDADDQWYFSLTAEGRPLTAAYSIFSDCFAAMAFSQYAQATGDGQAREIAASTYRSILRRRENPKGRFSKSVPGTRPLASLAVPMILSNLALELEWQIGAAECDAALDSCVDEIFRLFLDPEKQVLREHASPQGGLVDCFEGRLINPGHGIEAMWFLMDIAERRRDRSLAERAVAVTLRTLELGWDADEGGIFYFLDALARPPQQLEWDQKLWWVHAESLVALLKGLRLTGSKACAEWFERVHAYTWGHFADPEFGEWFGYLNRQGRPLLPLKGGKWKGCFHVPRALFLCSEELGKLQAPGRV
ncbi:MAG TPA: AGE family epimerase/isomerase [Opitutaceae bacterium]